MEGHGALKTVFLIHTGACNLLCSYCFNDGAEPELLTFDTISRFLDHKLEKHGREGSVIHFGGEPFFNRDVMMKTIEAYPFLSHQIVTNGTMIDRAFLQETLQYDVELELSIDGDFATTSSNRSLSPTDFDRLLSTIRFVRQHRGDEAVYSSTVANPATYGSLYSSVRYLFQEAGLRNIGWNLARGMGYVYEPAILARELEKIYHFAGENRIRFYCVIPLYRGEPCRHRSSICALTPWGDILSEQNVYAFRQSRRDVYDRFLLGNVENLDSLNEALPSSGFLYRHRKSGGCRGAYCTYLQLEDLLYPSAVKECMAISAALSSISGLVEDYYRSLAERRGES
jgi:MoaA/NifB/PqqE/SkfB family radical SAM enzyme